MPEVKGGSKGRSGGKQPAKGRGGKKPAPARDAVVKQTADASSIIIGVVFLVALLIGTAAWMGQSMSIVSGSVNNATDGFVKTVGLSVKTIRIYDAAPEQEVDILKAIGVKEGDSMFRADPKLIKSRLEKLSGLGDIQVHRFWPGQISIFVTPLKATFFYWNGETHLAMNPYGKIVPGVVYGEADFPVVSGAGAVKASAGLLADLNDYPVIKSRLKKAVRIGNRRWDLMMSSGARIQLPAGADERQKALARLKALHQLTTVLDRKLANVDLRDPARVYSRRIQVTADAQTNGGKG